MININIGNINNNPELDAMRKCCEEHEGCKECPADKQDVQIGNSVFRCETSYMRQEEQ